MLTPTSAQPAALVAEKIDKRFILRKTAGSHVFFEGFRIWGNCIEPITYRRAIPFFISTVYQSLHHLTLFPHFSLPRDVHECRQYLLQVPACVSGWENQWADASLLN